LAPRCEKCGTGPQEEGCGGLCGKCDAEEHPGEKGDTYFNPVNVEEPEVRLTAEQAKDREVRARERVIMAKAKLKRTRDEYERALVLHETAKKETETARKEAKRLKERLNI
jgi:hypothetical protein